MIYFETMRDVLSSYGNVCDSCISIWLHEFMYIVIFFVFGRVYCYL